MAIQRKKQTEGVKLLLKALKEIEDTEGKAGWFTTNKYPNGELVSYVATIQEYGCPSKNIPPRPFMRPALAENKKKWHELFAKGAVAILTGKRTATQVIGAITGDAMGSMKQNISDLTSPPLQEATIQARLRKRKNKTRTATIEKPLVDTGRMLQTLTWQTEKKK